MGADADTTTPGAPSATPPGPTATAPPPSGLPFTVAGKVILERRGSSARASVCDGAICTSTDAAGAYSLAGVRLNDAVVVTHPSYLRSERRLGAEPSVPGGTLTLPDVTLLGGDVDQNGQIYDTDAGRIAGSWGQTPGGPRWADSLDVTGDGKIGLTDMVAVQFNWSRKAPGPWAGANPLSLPRSPQAVAPAHLGAQTAAISLRPAQATLDVGQSDNVDIHVTDADALFLYNLRIEFDPKVLRVEDADPAQPGVQVTVGDFADQDNLFVVRNTVDNAAGVIELVVTETHPGDGSSGNGSLGSIRLTGLANGRSSLRFTEVRLFQDGFPEQVPLPNTATDGTVVVGTLKPPAIFLPRLARGR